ncbi:MAG TPA: hypothetical protein PLF13_05270 [candidate division Zixibacteria bacterium]|nr:hypothetical protein [candidate division Zixibacteria bacterium]
MNNSIYQHDPSGEKRNFVTPGVQHKYRETALVYVSRNCHTVCDWCFRKRLFKGQSLPSDRIAQIGPALDYFKRHREIHSVLLSGGDALLADRDYLQELIRGLEALDHIHSIRIGTRALVHDPDQYAARIPTGLTKRIFLVLHIVRPEEIRPGLRKVVDEFNRYGFLIQTPLLAGINDDAETLAELWYAGTGARLQPYYVFQCRPAIGNERFMMSFRDGHEVFAGAQSRCTGVVKTPRWVMSNSTGKWEIVMVEDDDVLFRCHQCIDPDLVGEVRRGNADDCWWDLPAEDSVRRYLPTILAQRHASGA